MSDPTIPASEPGDPTDVASALEVASELWENGSKSEAIRWLKRAVEAAADAGKDVRSDMLMKAVLDLERSTGEAAEVPARASPPAAPTAGAKPPPLPPSVAASASRPPPAPTASVAPRPPTHPPAAPTSTAPRAPTHPPSASVAAQRPATQPPAAPSPPSAALAAASRAPSHVPPAAASKAPARATPPPVSQTTAGASVATEVSSAAPHPRGSRIRVSVKTSVRDPNLLIVRPLSEGQALPPGTREGSLVLVGDEADARSSANGSPAP